jgi:hypothetical protein
MATDTCDIVVTVVEPNWVRVACSENYTTFDYIHIDGFTDMMPQNVADALEQSDGRPVAIRLWAKEED